MQVRVDIGVIFSCRVICIASNKSTVLFFIGNYNITIRVIYMVLHMLFTCCNYFCSRALRARASRACKNTLKEYKAEVKMSRSRVEKARGVF